MIQGCWEMSLDGISRLSETWVGAERLHTTNHWTLLGGAHPIRNVCASPTTRAGDGRCEPFSLATRYKTGCAGDWRHEGGPAAATSFWDTAQWLEIRIFTDVGKNNFYIPIFVILSFHITYLLQIHRHSDKVKGLVEKRTIRKNTILHFYQNYLSREWVLKKMP